MRKLLLIDGNAILHRAYYALPDWRNRSGEATAGVYGFLSMLLKALEELKPTHLVVVFDNPEPTFRHVMYVGYQATREKERQVSEDIWGQVEKLKAVMKKMGIPVFTLPGFEADDIIGTLSHQATDNKPKSSKGKTEVVIITGDKDLMQLVNKQVKLYMPLKGLSDNQLIDTEGVKDKLGVRPDQVIDYKALVGDSSDNYPGVAGVGPKTAVRLLTEYDSFDEIMAKVTTPGSQIQEKVKLKIAEGYEGGRLSKELATIKTDAPVTLEMDKCDVPVTKKILGVLKELGYKSLVKRLGGDVKEMPEVEDNQQTLF